MATESASDRDNTEIFQQLESYPWEKDTEFQGGLSAILGPATDASQVQELTLRAQVFYLSRKKSIPIDFDAYKSYLSSKSSKFHQDPAATSNHDSASITTAKTAEAEDAPPPPQHQVLSGSTSVPSTAHLPPTSALDTNSTNSTAPESTTTPSKPSQAPYPQTFAEIVQLITTGAPIPGIIDIPPTVLPEKATKPVAKKRRKPWELDVPDEVIEGKAEGTFGDRRDEIIVQELPE